jgi:hypothetical protein
MFPRPFCWLAWCVCVRVWPVCSDFDCVIHLLVTLVGCLTHRLLSASDLLIRSDSCWFPCILVPHRVCRYCYLISDRCHARHHHIRILPRAALLVSVHRNHVRAHVAVFGCASVSYLYADLLRLLRCSDYTESKMVRRVVTNASGVASMQIGFSAAGSPSGKVCFTDMHNLCVWLSLHSDSVVGAATAGRGNNEAQLYHTGATRASRNEPTSSCSHGTTTIGCN